MIGLTRNLSLDIIERWSKAEDCWPTREAALAALEEEGGAR